jgi:hypothetical protein
MLRILIAAAALLLTPPLLAGQRAMVDSDGDFIRLHDLPCVHAGTLGHVEPQLRPQMKKAEIRMYGKPVYGCWIEGPSGQLFVLLEDGRAAPFPPEAFTEEAGA